jgi:hypothetical protein
MIDQQDERLSVFAHGAQYPVHLIDLARTLLVLPTGGHDQGVNDDHAHPEAFVFDYVAVDRRHSVEQNVEGTVILREYWAFTTYDRRRILDLIVTNQKLQPTDRLIRPVHRDVEHAASFGPAFGELTTTSNHQR